MLLFSALLDIRKTMTKEAFVRLVIEWNQSSTYENNIISDLTWTGKLSFRAGNDDVWMSVQEYGRSIIAVRYEKKEDDGSIWDTDYVMNFDEMKMAVRLDRSYAADALAYDPKFSTPHFISLLEAKKYLQDDGDLPVSREPVGISMENTDLLSDIVLGKKTYRLPVVYVSRAFSDEEPVDVRRLAARLKGAAHVLVQEDLLCGYQIRESCADRNEYDGAVGIYFPTAAAGHKRFLCHAEEVPDLFLTEKVIRTVIQYCCSLAAEPLYTWQGVSSALLSERLMLQRKERQAAESARKKAEEEISQLLNSLEEEESRVRKQAYEEARAEADKILDGFDNDLQYLQAQVEELTKANDLLQYENQGLRAKLDTFSEIPVLYAGEEYEFYPGEIKDLIILTLAEYTAGAQNGTRRNDVIKDVIRNNDYQRISEKKAEEVKRLLKSYSGMTGPIRQSLEDMGFRISEDGKHWKLTYYGDERYQVILSKTPSDVRTGKNSSQKLNKLVF